MDVSGAEILYLRSELKGASEGPHMDIVAQGRKATVPERVTVLDALEAAKAEEFSLETSGFALPRHETRCADFRDQDLVRRVYWPETPSTRP